MGRLFTSFDEAWAFFLGRTEALERCSGKAGGSRRNSSSFEAVFRRINCFHSAVVVEVEAPTLRRFVAGTEADTAAFLPHMTIGVTERSTIQRICAARLYRYATSSWVSLRSPS